METNFEDINQGPVKIECAEKNEENQEEEIELTEKELKSKKRKTISAYIVGGSSILYFLSAGGFSNSFWWWIVVGVIVFSFLGIYGMKDECTKSALESVNAGLFLIVTCAFLLGVFLDHDEHILDNVSATKSNQNMDEHPVWASGKWHGMTRLGMTYFVTNGERYSCSYPGYQDEGTWYYSASQNVIFMNSDHESSRFGGVIRVVSHDLLDFGSDGIDLLSKR